MGNGSGHGSRCVVRNSKDGGCARCSATPNNKNTNVM